jgi:hypothetical protein
MNSIDGYGVFCQSSSELCDDLQSLIAVQLLPQVDYYILKNDPTTVYDAHHLRRLSMITLKSMKIAVLFTGTSRPETPVFPLPVYLIPFFVGINIPTGHSINPQTLAYYRLHEPIGCRDLTTLESLSHHGIKAYQSGCLTMLFKKKYNINKQSKKHYYIMNKVNPSDLKHSDTTQIKPTNRDLIKKNIIERLEFADYVLIKLMSAGQVTTDHIECYLPCLSFGVKAKFTGDLTRSVNKHLADLNYDQLKSLCEQTLSCIHQFIDSFTIKPQLLSFTVFLTTIGRPTLRRMLNSLVNQLTALDYLYIAIDGEDSVADTKSILSDYEGKWQCHLIIIEHKTNLGYWGHSLRNYYQKQLEGDYILHADDDNIYVDGAFDLIRKLVIHRYHLYVFQVEINKGHIVPQPDQIEINNIDTACGVVANLPHYFEEWKLCRGGDYNFWSSTAKHFHDSHIHFTHQVIYKMIGV